MPSRKIPVREAGAHVDRHPSCTPEGIVATPYLCRSWLMIVRSGHAILSRRSRREPERRHRLSLPGARPPASSAVPGWSVTTIFIVRLSCQYSRLRWGRCRNAVMLRRRPHATASSAGRRAERTARATAFAPPASSAAMPGVRRTDESRQDRDRQIVRRDQLAQLKLLLRQIITLRRDWRNGSMPRDSAAETTYSRGFLLLPRAWRRSLMVPRRKAHRHFT